MKMQNNIKKLIETLFFLILVSCTCVPDIDTPKEIIPSESAKIQFINANTDFTEADIYSSEIAVLKKLSYFWFNTNYYFIGVESTHIRLYSSTPKELIYSRAISDLEKQHKYTFIFFGNSEKSSSIIMNDSIENFNSDFAYIRCVHSSIDCKPVTVKLIKNFTTSIDLEQGTASNFSESFAGNYNIEFYEQGSARPIISITDVEFKNGTAYTVILKGSTNTSSENRLVCEIVELPK